jgi:hypothetical protein
VAVNGKPTISLTIEMPYPMTFTDREFWSTSSVMAFQPLVLAGAAVAEGNLILWRPEPDTQQWLPNVLGMMLEFGSGERLLVRLRIEGNFIWSADDSGLYLDGDSYGTPADGQTELLRDESGLLSGDGRRGGDFRMWFWLTRE